MIMRQRGSVGSSVQLEKVTVICMNRSRRFNFVATATIVSPPRPLSRRFDENSTFDLDENRLSISISFVEV